MSQANQPLTVEIIAYAPTGFYHCTHCEVVWQQTGFSRGLHAEQVHSALPPDLLNDYQAISDWVRQIIGQFCGQVQVKVVDAASLEGAWLTLRHGLRRYPAVLVGGQRFEGTNFGAAESAIAERVAALGAPAG